MAYKLGDRRGPQPKTTKNKYIRLNLANARIEKDLTQAELAKLVGCSHNHIFYVENCLCGCSFTLAKKIATVLDADLNNLLDVFEVEEQ